MSLVEQYWNEGWILRKGVLSLSECRRIIELLNKRDPKVYIPFSDVPWGYGNLMNDEDFNNILSNRFISNFCEAVLGEGYEFNHMMINNKAPWIGPRVEWHQERFNIDTFAPGASAEPDAWKKFLQVYIALDPHTLENGCLRIIPSSHTFGELEHEDIINSNMLHKRRVVSRDMNKIHAKGGIESVIMSPGDVLFFNHGLVHGSSANISPLERRSVVIQARVPIEKDNEVFVRETQHRRNFVKQTFLEIIHELDEKNMYDDFKRGPNEDK